MHRIYWTGYCLGERMSVIQQVENVIQPFGFITDFKRFSDVALTLIIELPAGHLEQLYLELTAIMEMKEWKPGEDTTAKHCEIALEINFGSASGQLTIDTPAVPG
ncbi:MAG TPA: hypothetical protein VLL95_01905 [Phnomibacter sp.]|nr:hypothetical protein [Phnomibacter sp.]